MIISTHVAGTKTLDNVRNGQAASPHCITRGTVEPGFYPVTRRHTQQDKQPIYPSCHLARVCMNVQYYDSVNFLLLFFSSNQFILMKTKAVWGRKMSFKVFL